MITMVWLTYLSPAVDILLIAFVFYQVLLLIKGTHSVQVVMGLAVLMGMTLVIRHFLKLPAGIVVVVRVSVQPWDPGVIGRPTTVHTPPAGLVWVVSETNTVSPGRNLRFIKLLPVQLFPCAMIDPSARKT